MQVLPSLLIMQTWMLPSVRVTFLCYYTAVGFYHTVCCMCLIGRTMAFGLSQMNAKFSTPTFTTSIVTKSSIHEIRWLFGDARKASVRCSRSGSESDTAYVCENFEDVPCPRNGRTLQSHLLVKWAAEPLIGWMWISTVADLHRR